MAMASAICRASPRGSSILPRLGLKTFERKPGIYKELDSAGRPLPTHKQIGEELYITKEAVQSTLSEVSILMKADVVFYMSYVKQALLDKPELCFGKGYSNAEKKAETVMNLSARVGEPWISFYTEKEIAKLMAEFGFTIVANNTLGDLNEAYFGPVGRALKENQLFNLELIGYRKLIN